MILLFKNEELIQALNITLENILMEQLEYKELLQKKNEDIYQFRIDFPHRGENGIHINLEETKNEELIFTGYPVSIEELSDIKISEESLFKIFFRLDGFYWFKVNPKNNISQISENQIEKIN